MNVPANSYYIGRGHRKLHLPRSDFCNPFKIGIHGDRAQVVTRFRDWVVTQRHLMDKLEDLRGKLLLCHCEIGMPCHGIVLLQLLAQGAHRQ